MTNKEKIREFLVGMANADCCTTQVAKTIKKIILPYIDSLQEEPVSEELEVEIKRYVYDPYFNLNGVAIKGATEYLTVEDVADIARHFANWQKEQMITKAIDGKVLINGMGNPILHLWDKGRHLIDKKVKVIVIKNE